MPAPGTGGRSRNEVLGAAHDYGAAHADQFGSVRWDGDRLVVTFTGDLDQHRRNLGTLLGDLSLVDVKRCDHTRTELELVHEEIRARYGGSAKHILQRTGPGIVQVRAPFANVAAELHARYGDALDITVGQKPYPPGKIRPLEPIPLPSATATWPDLQVELDLGDRSGPSGDDLRGKAVLTNRGSRRLHFLTSPTVKGGLHAGDNRVGVLTGGHTLVGRIVELEPSETATLGLIIGTAPCTPDDLYTLPVGRYGVFATLDLTPRDDVGQPIGRHQLLYLGPDITLTEPDP